MLECGRATNIDSVKVSTISKHLTSSIKFIQNIPLVRVSFCKVCNLQDMTSSIVHMLMHKNQIFCSELRTSELQS